MSSLLAIVVSGAPLATRAVDLATAAISVGWDVSMVATESALPWLDEDVVQEATGHPLRHQFRSRDRPKPPRPDAVAAMPATFNLVNKLAAGISDNYATSLLCESLGAGFPVVVAPMINERLWGHPVLVRNIEALVEAGVVFVDIRTGARRAEAVPSGSSGDVTAGFEPEWVLAALPLPS